MGAGGEIHRELKQLESRLGPLEKGAAETEAAVPTLREARIIYAELLDCLRVLDYRTYTRKVHTEVDRSSTLLASFPWLSYASAIFITLFSLLFGLGPSAVSLVICVEIFTQSSRAAALVIAGSINWMGLYLTGMVFPYVVSSLGPFCFLIFLAVAFFTVIFLYIFLPETKGKSVLEVAEEFYRSRSSWKQELSPEESSQRQEQVMSTRL
ncbi:hypothetical protein NDU88_006678 [Pleurodeles waltl]|uniref:Major facilitator superfamily (MFS) profile domain-containing protein n=1 Tax=Pleurodeles waltl TaxID=8319 RepID=A0AAV7LRD0_PLEWA|nr:hypothetical protein NDU88_006678 [Pleurodeles waltl]